MIRFQYPPPLHNHTHHNLHHHHNLKSHSQLQVLQIQYLLPPPNHPPLHPPLLQELIIHHPLLHPLLHPLPLGHQNLILLPHLQEQIIPHLSSSSSSSSKAPM